MTGEDRLLLNELRASVQRLFQEYDKLKTEKEMLENNVAALTHEIARVEQDKAELIRKNERMKFANHILSGKDQDGEAKKRINILLREIDKCIALLNK